MLHCIVHSYQFRQAKIIRKTDILYKKDKKCLEIKFKNTDEAKIFLVENNLLFKDLEIVKGSMDDVFLSVTGKDLKENV